LLFIVTGFFALKKSIHFFILNLLAFTIIYLIVGVMGFSWYIKEIATLFLVLGLASGIAMNSSANEIVRQFSAGMKDILTAAFIVGLAGGILVILEDGMVIDSLLYYMSKSMQEFGKIASVTVMYIIQTGINIVIPSGSAKAALTMPIMSQFSDLIGISRQATVMAFQFGDGFTNMITPTSAVLIGVLGIARIPYEKWVKWILPFMAIPLASPSTRKSVAISLMYQLKPMTPTIR
ncbi:MAG: AbgT family transporter, partial [Bacteroidales bacterium]|nr:AbgT family transporter [Bacteroidales bacterium]